MSGSRFAIFTVILCAFLGGCNGFVLLTTTSSSRSATSRLYAGDDSGFKIQVAMPPTNSGLQANLSFESVIEGDSEIVEVRYSLPFGLNVEPKNGLALCTKDGEGGEKVGDVLRFCSQWTLGLPRGSGIATTAAAFSGSVSWQCTMFNVRKAGSWDQVVEALVSNEQSRTDEVVLIFERPTAAEAE